MRPSFFQLAILGGAVAALAAAIQKARVDRMIAAASGSTTNASDAVDDIELRPDASPEEILDAGVKETFPASDPVSVNSAYESAYEKELRRKRAG